MRTMTNCMITIAALAAIISGSCSKTGQQDHNDDDAVHNHIPWSEATIDSTTRLQWRGPYLLEANMFEPPKNDYDIKEWELRAKKMNGTYWRLMQYSPPPEMLHSFLEVRSLYAN